MAKKANFQPFSPFSSGGAFFVLRPFELFLVEKCPEGRNSHFKTVLVDIHGHGFLRPMLLPSPTEKVTLKLL